MPAKKAAVKKAAVKKAAVKKAVVKKAVVQKAAVKKAVAKMAPDLDDLSPAARKVSQDVTRGLKKFFAPSGGFMVASGFRDSAPITNGTHTAVVWEYAGVHTAAFQGIQPTKLPVVIRGVTVLFHAPGQTALYHRYVDWSDVMAQLGLDTTGRPALDELPT